MLAISHDKIAGIQKNGVGFPGLFLSISFKAFTFTSFDNELFLFIRKWAKRSELLETRFFGGFAIREQSSRR